MSPLTPLSLAVYIYRERSVELIVTIKLISLYSLFIHMLCVYVCERDRERERERERDRYYYLSCFSLFLSLYISLCLTISLSLYIYDGHHRVVYSLFIPMLCVCVCVWEREGERDHYLSSFSLFLSLSISLFVLLSLSLSMFLYIYQTPQLQERCDEGQFFWADFNWFEFSIFLLLDWLPYQIKNTVCPTIYS